MNVRLHPVLAAASMLSLLAAVACGGDDSSGGSGGGGAAGSTGAAGSGTAGSGSIPGLLTFSCNKPDSKKCSIKGESTQAALDMAKQECTDGGYTVVEHCPTDALVGCCVISGVGECYYDAMAASAVMGVCTSSGGKWTTSPP